MISAYCGLACKNSLLVKILRGKKTQINFQIYAHFFFNFQTLLIYTTLPKMFCIPKVAKIFEDAKIINWRFLWNVRILYCRKVSIFHTVQKCHKLLIYDDVINVHLGKLRVVVLQDWAILETFLWGAWPVLTSEC